VRKSGEIKTADMAIDGVSEHARASRAAVRLSTTADMLRIEITDDGRGFDPSRIGLRLEEASGCGLFSIRERSQLIGGDLVIESNAGHGTRIVLRAPFSVQAGAST
jgi:signal transduction histidine kinase